ncbi:homeobox-leucine zipper protein family [Striga asiatica]|uniref:Homeobox-leucine zipper protein family n=1 Tax=Striga asiatica TaxID=4170 RepID=A0A5A7R5R9_STRAF|nr:homeobox-leucine zipper protein family [Striga asiatica]
MDEKNDEEVRLGLDLALGLNDCNPKKNANTPQNNKRAFFLDLSIPLHQTSNHGTTHESSSSRINNDFRGKLVDDDESKLIMDFSCRKKLRLTRDQTTLLEDSFKKQTTLNTAQKQALAEKLNLKARQVEVWFQNRRARTKLKQTEVDCEFLKRNCERLSEENWRLKKELFELRSSLKKEGAMEVVQNNPNKNLIGTSKKA